MAFASAVKIAYPVQITAVTKTKTFSPTRWWSQTPRHLGRGREDEDEEYEHVLELLVQVRFLYFNSVLRSTDGQMFLRKCWSMYTDCSPG